MLREAIEAADAHRLAVERAFLHGFLRRTAFQHFEAVAWREQCARGFIVAVVGAADALDKACAAFGRADLDDEIDVAPVNAKIERRRADDGAELASRHGGFDLATLRDVERAVMKRNRQRVFVDAPKLLKGHFRLSAGVDENQCELGGFDLLVDFRDGVTRSMARPRDVGVGV